MPQSHRSRSVPSAPAGSNTVNPFIWTHDAVGLLEFLVAVFEAHEVREARTIDTDGLVLHSELLVGDSTLTIADRKLGWPYTPAFTRVYVDDVAATLDRARSHGARIVTEPTDFWGDTLSRFADPFGNLWWVYRHDPVQASWEDGESAGATDGVPSASATSDESWESFTTPELDYIHSTLVAAMTSLRDPRSP